MIADIRYLVSTFNRADKIKLMVYVVAQFFVSLMDLVGLAAVLPLMQVLMGASLDEGYISALHRLMGSPSRNVFVLATAGLMVVAFALKAVLGLALQWKSSGFILRLQIATSSRLLATYLDQDYLAHRGRDTADVIKKVDTSVADAHGKVLGGLLTLLSSGLSILLILFFLFTVAPWVTLVALVYFGFIVWVLQRVLAKRNEEAGRDAVMSAWSRSLALVNAAMGFREIRMHEAADVFVDRFRSASVTNGFAGRRANFYAALPKYVLEISSIVGIALILSMTLLSRDPATMMPTLTLFVAATVKLMPIMSALTSTFGTIRSGRTGLAIAAETLREETPSARRAIAAPSHPVRTDKAQAIEVRDLTFRYPDGVVDVLKDVSLTVPPGTSLALCGQSGSGKTTLVDILLGLLPPTAGSVTYGGLTPSDLGSSWHELVAYVPQDVYTSNGTLADNVAFGLDPSQFERRRIEEALERAQLADVVAGMPDGIDTEIGDRGARLSGGQRQRLRIARALYRNPQVIVFDEATSALDNETEDRISRTIRGMAGEITTIIVAHRLSTVKHVDQLAYIAQGRVEALGTFSEVQAESAEFAHMVELGSLDMPAADAPLEPKKDR